MIEMLPILKKLYRFNILNKPGESFQGITVTEEAFQNAVQEYEKEIIRDFK